MALPFVTYIGKTNADLSSSTLIDATIYGGANPARNTLAIYVALYKRDALNNDTQITIANTTPLTAIEWPFTLPAPDGVFVSMIFAFTVWTAGVHATMTGVFYNGVYYRSNTSTSGTPGVSADWDVITDIVGTFTGNATVDQAQTYNFSADRARAGQLGDSMAALGQRMISGQCKNWEEAAAVLTGCSLIESAWTNFRRANHVDAQNIMDYVDATTSLTI